MASDPCFPSQRNEAAEKKERFKKKEEIKLPHAVYTSEWARTAVLIDMMQTKFVQSGRRCVRNISCQQAPTATETIAIQSKLRKQPKG